MLSRGTGFGFERSNFSLQGSDLMLRSGVCLYNRATFAFGRPVIWSGAELLLSCPQSVHLFRLCSD